MIVSPKALDISVVHFGEPVFVEGRWTNKESSWSPNHRSSKTTEEQQRLDRQEKDAAALDDSTFKLLTTLNTALMHLKFGDPEKARTAIATVKRLRAQGHGSEPKFGVDKTLAALNDVVEQKKWVLRDPCQHKD